MKIRNKMLKGLLSVLVLTGLFSQAVMAADPMEISEEHPYTYTVTLSAGNQGSFASGDTIVREELNYGDYVNFNWREQLTIADEKYYAKGIRRSGDDNSNSFITDQVQVTGDEDYVVAYGVLGEMVAYTVQYLDQNGKELAPSKTFYGAVGDRPVVAFQYIEGYLPQAYNLTKTLSENEAENVFPFRYAPAAGVQNVTVVVGGNSTVVTTPEGTTTGGTTAGGTTTQGVAGENQTTAGENEVEVEDEDVPKDLVNLDEEEVPLANQDLEDTVRDTSVVPLVLGILVAVIAVAVILGAVLYYKKKNR